MTLPRNRGEVPAEELLGRRAFALAPWIVVSVVAVALAVSEVIRDRGATLEWLVVGAALITGALSAGLAIIQDKPFALRYRRSLWVYVVGSFVVLLLLSAVSACDEGLASVCFAGACPLAAYVGFVFPPSLRYVTLAGLVGAAAAVQVIHPAAHWFDVAVVGSMVFAAWWAGQLVALGHARIAKISRLLSSFDHVSGSLNRRGFMEQLEREVGVRDDDSPLALLLIDFIGFRFVNDAGFETGDDVLRWIGTRLPGVLPDTAELGRLGDDEFAVLLPGARRGEAEEVARTIRMDLHGRISARIGVATSETRDVDAPDLFRVADAALDIARREPLGLHVLVAGTIRTSNSAAATRPGQHRPLSYAQVRATGRVPRVDPESRVNARIVTLSVWIVAIAGIPVVAHGMVVGGDAFFDQVVRYGGIPWILAMSTLAHASRGRVYGSGNDFGMVVLVTSSLLLAVGLSAAALADGGLTSPVLAAMFVKVLFDAATNPRYRSPISFVAMLGGWLLVVGLGPASVLWVVPFHLALFAGSFALGTIGHRAMQQTASHAKSRVYVDDLTQLPNRAGFQKWAEEAFFVSATTTGAPFGVLSFRIKGLHAFNQTRGHAAGDALLRDVAELLVERLPEHYVIGRTGAAEFTAAVGMSKARDAIWLTDEIRAAIQDVVGVQVGYATCPEDGASVCALWRAAEHRVVNGRPPVLPPSLIRRGAVITG